MKSSPLKLISQNDGYQQLNKEQSTKKKTIYDDLINDNQLQKQMLIKIKIISMKIRYQQKHQKGEIYYLKQGQKHQQKQSHLNKKPVIKIQHSQQPLLKYFSLSATREQNQPKQLIETMYAKKSQLDKNYNSQVKNDIIKDKIGKDIGKGLLGMGQRNGEMFRNIVEKWGYIFGVRYQDHLIIQFKQTKIKQKIKKEDFYKPNQYQQNLFYAKFPVKPFLAIPYIKHEIDMEMLHKKQANSDFRDSKFVATMQLQLQTVPHSSWGTLHLQPYKLTLTCPLSSSLSPLKLTPQISLQFLSPQLLTLIPQKIKPNQITTCATWQQHLNFDLSSKKRYLQIRLIINGDEEGRTKQIDLLGDGYLGDRQMVNRKVEIWRQQKIVATLQIRTKFQIAKNITLQGIQNHFQSSFMNSKHSI